MKTKNQCLGLVEKGIRKQIFVGICKNEQKMAYLNNFIEQDKKQKGP